MASVAEALSPGSPREDVAHVVAAALDPRTRFQGTLRRHWARDINAAETARQISLLVGRELRYEDESVAEGRKWRNILGAPDWEVDTWLGSYEAIAVGELDAVSDTVLQFTGVQPFSLSQYFGKHPVFLNKLRQVLNGQIAVWMSFVSNSHHGVTRSLHIGARHSPTTNEMFHEPR